MGSKDERVVAVITVGGPTKGIHFLSQILGLLLFYAIQFEFRLPGQLEFWLNMLNFAYSGVLYSISLKIRLKNLCPVEDFGWICCVDDRYSIQTTFSEYTKATFFFSWAAYGSLILLQLVKGYIFFDYFSNDIIHLLCVFGYLPSCWII